MAYRPVRAIEVRAWGRTVGALALNPASGLFAFQFSRDWAAAGPELAPLHMPLTASKTYEFAGLSDETYRRLPPLLADSLPDKFGNALVDRWMAEQGIAVGEFSVLDRLAYAADRSIGALEFQPPATDGPREASAVQLADLVLAARSALGSDGPLSVDQGALEQLIDVGSSAGGARPKAVVAYNPDTNQISSAYRDLPEGFAHWLFKLDGVGAKPLDGHTEGLGTAAHYGQVEYAYYLMATAAGATMSRCELLAEGPRRHFITRRFDRNDDGSKNHVVTLCGLAHLDFNMIGAHSYDQYFETIRALGLPQSAVDEAFRRMVFNVAAANCDDHTKNFSFLRRPDGDWELAPAYDITFSHDPKSVWTRQHLMSVNSKFSGIGVKDLREVGVRRDVVGVNAIIAEVLDAVARWREFAAAADLNSDETDRIAGVLADHRPS